MKYYLIAGEASGDLHGANLMAALKQADSAAEFRFFGGDKMKAEGGELVKHISEMAFMGFVEVAMNLRTILRNLSSAKQDVLDFTPDALVLIDFPGFNLKIAEFAKQQGIKVFYYISPKIWAWNRKRVYKIMKVVDKMLCILPFEVDFYERFGFKADYVGNPILDAIAAHVPDPGFRESAGISGKPVIALLPGSRKQEISRILPEMISAAGEFPGHHAVIAGAPGFDAAYYLPYTSGKFPVVFDKTYDLLLCAEAAVVTSGTATLETALLKTPQVVVYKGNKISIAIARMVVKIGFISLVNLIMGKKIVEELIQEECNKTRIFSELDRIVNNTVYKSEMLANYAELAIKVGDSGASTRAAALIFETIDLRPEIWQEN